MGSFIPPSPRERNLHWKAQQASVFRAPYSRDAGLQIIHSTAEVREVLNMEVQGQAIDLLRHRSPATTYSDPIALAQAFIRSHHEGAGSTELAAQVNSVESQLLYLILCGDMSDNQRANALVKLSKLLFEAQKHQEALLHKDREIELKRQGNLMKAEKLREEIQAAKERRSSLAAQAVLDGELTE